MFCLTRETGKLRGSGADSPDNCTGNVRRIESAVDYYWTILVPTKLRDEGTS